MAEQLNGTSLERNNEMKELIDRRKLLGEIVKELSCVHANGGDVMFHVIEIIKSAEVVAVLPENDAVVIHKD